MCPLPSWVQYLQAFSTPTVALLAIVIGVMQWRTAHQRAVLDLFDRRMENYEAINSAVAQILREGAVASQTIISFDMATSKTPFLFGKEVEAYLADTRKIIVALRLCANLAKTDDDAKRAKYADLEAKHLMTLTGFYQEFANLVRPYVKMHQKAPPF